MTKICCPHDIWDSAARQKLQNDISPYWSPLHPSPVLRLPGSAMTQMMQRLERWVVSYRIRPHPGQSEKVACDLPPKLLKEADKLLGIAEMKQVLAGEGVFKIVSTQHLTSLCLPYSDRKSDRHGDRRTKSCIRLFYNSRHLNPSLWEEKAKNKVRISTKDIPAAVFSNSSSKST